MRLLIEALLKSQVLKYLGIGVAISNTLVVINIHSLFGVKRAVPIPDCNVCTNNNNNTYVVMIE